MASTLVHRDDRNGVFGRHGDGRTAPEIGSPVVLQQLLESCQRHEPSTFRGQVSPLPVTKDRLDPSAHALEDVTEVGHLHRRPDGGRECPDCGGTSGRCETQMGRLRCRRMARRHRRQSLDQANIGISRCATSVSRSAHWRWHAWPPTLLESDASRSCQHDKTAVSGMLTFLGRPGATA
jgi:hypothetical protein